MDDKALSANEETRAAWNANAEVWDARMGDGGNDFFRLLQWPAIALLLQAAEWSPEAPPRILDIACGNGLTSRHLAALGAEVTAFDFSAELIKRAQARANQFAHPISYRTLDATDESALLSLGEGAFAFALCNMALFDIADIGPLFHALPKLLEPGGAFVFSLTHPAFNNASAVRVMEESDIEGEIRTVFSVKISRYINPYAARGLALRNQPKPQLYFERPLQDYLQLGFENGFVLDGFEERAFPPDAAQKNPLDWGGNFSEIPPVIVARLRLSAPPVR
jgi:2-polyprenyl-3-methyl-5-hydroxy-6-metoxy-1,4-benzoquinol methylase